MGKIISSLVEAAATAPAVLAAFNSLDLQRIIVFQPYFYDDLKQFFLVPAIASFGIFVGARTSLRAMITCIVLVLLLAFAWGAIFFQAPVSNRILNFIGVLLNLTVYSSAVSLLAAEIWRRSP